MASVVNPSECSISSSSIPYAMQKVLNTLVSATMLRKRNGEKSGKDITALGVDIMCSHGRRTYVVCTTYNVHWNVIWITWCILWRERFPGVISFNATLVNATYAFSIQQTWWLVTVAATTTTTTVIVVYMLNLWAQAMRIACLQCIPYLFLL